MQVVNKKAEQNRLVRVLRERKSSIEVQAMLQLLEVLLDAKRADLVNATMDTFQGTQGEAKAYQYLSKLLTQQEISPTESV